MPIGTNAEIWQFGTLTTVSAASPASIVNAAFSVAGDQAALTNTDDVIFARMMLKCQWATITGVANRMISIYARPINIFSTDDVVQPSLNEVFQRVGFFWVYAAAATTNYDFVSTLLELPAIKASQELEFYLENQTGQTITAGWLMKIMPMARGPHA